MSSASAGPALHLSLEKAKKDNAGFIRASVRPFLLTFLGPIPPKLVFIAATFAQPYVVQSMLSFISSYSSGGGPPQPAEHGWGLVGAYAAVYLMIAVSTAFYWDKVYASVVTYRAALVSVIFQKTLRLSAGAAQTEGSGAAITYMSVDVERVVEGAVFFHEAWSALLSVVVAAVVLWYQASFAMLAALGVILVFLVVTAIIAGTVQKAQMNWMGATQNRVKFITSIMQNILPIKLSSLEPQVTPRVIPLREIEINHMKSFYRRVIIVAILSTATVNFAGVAALGAYVGIQADVLRPEKLFTILTIVNLITLPISTIGHVFPQLLASFGSLQRIENFLALEEKNTSSASLFKTKGNLEEPNQITTPTHRKSPSATSSATISLDEKLVVGDDRLITGDILLQSASFGFEIGGKAIIDGISATFEAGKLTMLVGPVGCGKSVLLTSLLRETYLLHGQCSPLHGVVAYAAQDAFLWPTSIRENVILNSPFDPRWYETVIAACRLGTDLERMTNGDLTQVGEKGASISGGQKQRIALARAVYSKAEVTLLDDSFSALDSHTALAVFDSLLGTQGLLRGRTVVLATHSLQHLPFADNILVLEDGHLVTQGNLQSLLSGTTDVYRFVNAGQHQTEGISDVVAVITASVGDAGLSQKEGLSAERDTQDKDHADNQKTKKEESQDEDDEQAGVLGSRGWGPYKFFLEACGWSRLSIAAICLVAYTLMEIGLQIFLKQWSETGTTRHGPWLGGYAAFSVGVAIAGLIAFFSYSLITTPHASLVIHSLMTKSILEAPLSYFQLVPSGRLINRYAGDMNVIDFAFPAAVIDFTFSIAFVLGALVLIFLAVPWLALSVPVLGYVYWLLQKFYLATSRQLQRLEMGSKTPLFSTFETTLSGLLTVRAFRAEGLLLRQSEHLLDRSQAPMYYRNAGIRFLRTTLSFMTLFLAVGVALLAVGLRNSTSAGFLGVTLSQLVNFSTSLQNVILAWTRVENGVVAVERVREICSVDSEQDPPQRDIEPSATQWPSTGRVEFKNVTLRYKMDQEPALKDVSLDIPGGSTMGVCGRTGSGKSTTLLALLGAVDPSLLTGKILIDGVDISTIPRSQLRSSISIVSQDPFLLHLSIRDNLIVGFPCDPPGDNEIWAALERVGMRETVGSLEQKLDTVISSDGLEFSRGERQLLCIARVLLEKRKIIVLDEASSSMDHTTEQRLQEVLQHDLAGCTCVAVAHRIVSIVNFDAVAVLDHGKVVETGCPATLMQLPDSRFWGLAKNQGIV